MRSGKLSGILYGVVLLLVGSFSLAKEMPQRLGVGIKNNTSQSVPSLAMVYHLNSNLAMTGGFGVDTKKNNSATQIQVGIRHHIFQETNLHFYAGGQLGVLTYEDPVAGKESGFEADVLAGVEFFFTGLENVGFTCEGGLGLSTLGSTRIRTIAHDPFKAGIIFYF